MFRLSQYIRSLHSPAKTTSGKAVPPTHAGKKPSGPVVIWNLIRRCNLTCKHCYATSADKDFPGELSTQQIYQTLEDLKHFAVPVLILSGGEPLMHPDIFAISQRAKAMGFYVGLSSNGTLIDKHNIKQIQAIGYNYVGISIDGSRDIHDRFRRKQGAFDQAIEAIRLCRDAGIKVGLRFTLTQDNHQDLPFLLELMQQEQIDKFYLSHLNYAGRGNKNRKDDLHHQMTRQAMDLLFETCWQDSLQGNKREFVTGNNDADGVYLLLWMQKNHPEFVEPLRQKLQSWGGNASGVHIANIDNLGNVHPDTMWWDYTLGNVKERPFSQIWQDTSDPLMAGLKQKRRPLEGRCARCGYFDLCGGNSRTRAWQLTGNFWAEDPGCYLSDEELHIHNSTKRLVATPWSRKTTQHAKKTPASIS